MSSTFVITLLIVGIASQQDFILPSPNQLIGKMQNTLTATSSGHLTSEAKDELMKARAVAIYYDDILTCNAVAVSPKDIAILKKCLSNCGSQLSDYEARMLHPAKENEVITYKLKVVVREIGAHKSINIIRLDKAIHYEDFYDGVFIEGLNVNQFAEAEEKITSYGLSLRETENSNKLEHQLHKYENQKLVSYEIEIGFKQDEKDGPLLVGESLFQDYKLVGLFTQYKYEQKESLFVATYVKLPLDSCGLRLDNVKEPPASNKEEVVDVSQ